MLQQWCHFRIMMYHNRDIASTPTNKEYIIVHCNPVYQVHEKYQRRNVIEMEMLLIKYWSLLEIALLQSNLFYAFHSLKGIS